MTIKFITKESLQKKRAPAKFKPGVDLREHLRVSRQGDVHVAEFVGSGDFADAFYTRQQYEVDAGRDEEPLLYLPIYNPIEDANLPKDVSINVIGPGGVVFEEVTEGGEVKFATVGESSKSLSLGHFATGIEYSQDLVDFNQVWNLGIFERAAGKAHNALLNHLHLNPILAYSYAAANQTAASSTGSTLAEKYLHTLEDAVTAARTDTSNPRRPPYSLLIAGANAFTVEYALKQHIQDGANPNMSSLIGMISEIIVYDGWTGTRGKKSTTYSGVTAGKAYLISKAYMDQDFQSWVKFLMRNQRGDGDLSRFIVEQVLFDSRLGVYSNPLRAVEEITWPTS